MKKACVPILGIGFMLVLSSSVYAMNYTTPDGCAGCHRDEGKRYVVVSTWKQSTHADNYDYLKGTANDYCAKCHSPQEHTAGATYATKQPVMDYEWQGVSCYSCHSPRKVENGIVYTYRLGNYIPGSGDPTTATVAELDNMYVWASSYSSLNAQCTYCHNSSARNHLDVPFDNKTGQKKMNKGTTTCVTCHLPPWNWSAVKDGETLTAYFKGHSMKASFQACLQTGCHDKRTSKWAQDKIDSGVPHGTAFMTR
jgi:nitrate/TMAO reductase-like tetraheme cytochrome c subunit